MRSLGFAVTAATASLVLCTAASAAVPHIVQPGETLWSIAGANGLSPSALAAANGLSPAAHVVLGSTIEIPGPGVPSAPVGSSGAGEPDGDSDDSPAAGSAGLGAHTVLPGETLSGIAARAGVSVSSLAAMNGVSPEGVLRYGMVLRLPTGAAGSQALPSAGPPAAAPSPTPVRVTSGVVGSIAAQNGVPPSLASAIGWQESGFNNAAVSSANARGVMQIMPGTWQWIQNNLALSPLDPNSASDNVKAGVLYLGHLLRDSGGDPAQAAAGYYQGLDSVRAHGMFPDTQRYVANVLALRNQFGGP